MNSFKHSGVPLDASDILTVGRELGIEIPSELARFYERTNGGFPDNGSWIVDGEEVVRVQCFLPMKTRTKFSNTIEATYQTGLNDGYLVKGLVPFAKDFGGNFVCFDGQGGVVFYTMDTWSANSSDDTNKRYALNPITDTFQHFLDGLQPEPEY